MSIASTHYVTRDFAIAAILLKLHTATDKQLENMLEEAIHNRFYNFILVNNLEGFENRVLTDITSLPEYNEY